MLERARLVPLLALTIAVGAAGCRSRGPAPAGSSGGRLATGSSMSLNRGDWLVGENYEVHLVLAEPQGAGAPERLGYVITKRYREMRGGPEFTMHEVTGLDRENAVGMVDALGNATRFALGPDGSVESVPAGNNALVLGVQAIFQTTRPITLEKTTERALAFEAMDGNRDGYLDRAEFPRLADRVGNPDRNRDGRVDAQEFETADL
jgi:hypothetical protein